MVKMNATAPERLREHRERSALPLSLNNARQLGGIVLRDGRLAAQGSRDEVLPGLIGTPSAVQECRRIAGKEAAQ